MKNEMSGLIGNRIFQLRVDVCQMTQEEFAIAIGAKYQHMISEYESGLVRPGVNKCAAMINLALKFGKQIDLNWIRPDLTQSH